MQEKVILDKGKLYRYLKEVDPNTLTNEDLVLHLCGIELVEKHYDTFSLINTTTSVSSLICCMMVPSSIFVALGITSAVFTVYNTVLSHKTQKLQENFADVLLRRYDSFFDAYKQTATLIQLVEFEDLLRLFEKAGALDE